MLHSHGDCIFEEVSKKELQNWVTPFYFLNSSKTINFGEKCSQRKVIPYKIQNSTVYSNPFFSCWNLSKYQANLLIKILWQFFCSHAIFTDLTIPGKLSGNLALETTKWDKSFKMKTNKCYRSILQKYFRKKINTLIANILLSYDSLWAVRAIFIYKALISMYPYKVPRNTGRLSSKVLRLLHRDTGPSIWLFSLYTLHIVICPLLFQETFSKILQSETLLFQLSFTSSAIARSSNKSN